MGLRCMLLVIDMRQKAESFYQIRKSFFSRPERAFGALTTTIFIVLSSFPGSPLSIGKPPVFPKLCRERTGGSCSYGSVSLGRSQGLISLAIS